jgi:hypothetical protein
VSRKTTHADVQLSVDSRCAQSVSAAQLSGSPPLCRRHGGYKLYGSGKLEHWISGTMDVFDEYYPASTQQWNAMCDANWKL